MRWSCLPIAATCAAALAACAGSGSQQPAPSAATAQSMGQWSIKPETNRLTDKTSLTATIAAKQAFISNSNLFNNVAILVLTCNNALFSWGFPVGRKGAAVLSYRLDATPSKDVLNADFPPSDIVSISGVDARTFINSLSAATSLYVQVASVVGMAHATFDVTGADVVVSQINSDCPSPTAPPKPSPAKKKR